MIIKNEYPPIIIIQAPLIQSHISPYNPKYYNHTILLLWEQFGEYPK